MSAPDRRLTLIRDGLADRRLEGLVVADRFAAVTPMQVSAPAASLRKAAAPDAEQGQHPLQARDKERKDQCKVAEFGGHGLFCACSTACLASGGM